MFGLAFAASNVLTKSGRAQDRADALLDSNIAPEIMAVIVNNLRILRLSKIFC